MCEMEMSPALSAFGREKDLLVCAGNQAEAMKRELFPFLAAHEVEDAALVRLQDGLIE